MLECPGMRLSSLIKGAHAGVADQREVGIETVREPLDLQRVPTKHLFRNSRKSGVRNQWSLTHTNGKSSSRVSSKLIWQLVRLLKKVNSQRAVWRRRFLPARSAQSILFRAGTPERSTVTSLFNPRRETPAASTARRHVPTHSRMAVTGQCTLSSLHRWKRALAMLCQLTGPAVL
jgi:hypothetical protein